MAFKDLLNGLFKNKNPGNSNMQYAKFIDGSVPIFSQFGNDVFASDVVQICIDIIATELSKLRPTHIRTDKEGIQTIPSGSLNRLFKFGPNSIMSTRDFLEKITWLLMANNNCFIYPIYENKTDRKGNKYREYTEFYPLNPTQVDFLRDTSGKLFVQLYFQAGNNFTLPYEDLIHLRKKFSLNEIMGGGRDGQPDNDALLKTLEINDTLLQGLDKAIKSSLCIRGVFNINTMLDGEAQKKERQKFEDSIKNNESGILALDLKGDYVPISTDPKLIDKETLAFLRDKILPYYRVSLPIFLGDYTDEQYQAFYEAALEPIIISLGQAFSKTIFTTNELNFGNEIIFFQKDLSFLSVKSKLELLKTAGEQGLFSDDEKLAILGYPPLMDGTGKRRTMSLNYIDVSLANDYQINKSKTGGTNNNGQGQ